MSRLWLLLVLCSIFAVTTAVYTLQVRAGTSFPAPLQAPAFEATGVIGHVGALVPCNATPPLPGSFTFVDDADMPVALAPVTGTGIAHAGGFVPVFCDGSQSLWIVF